MKKLLAVLVMLGFAGTLCFAAEAPNTAPVAAKEPVKATEKTEAKATKKAFKKGKKAKAKKQVEQVEKK